MAGYAILKNITPFSFHRLSVVLYMDCSEREINTRQILSGLMNLIQLAWAAAVVCLVLAIIEPRLHSVLEYGKLRRSKDGIVPQHLFWPSIYAIGLIVNVVFAVLFLVWASSSVAQFLLVLFFVHLTRRFIETTVVHRFSRRFMPPLHVFLGPAYYIGVTMGPQIEELAKPHSVPPPMILALGLTLFVWASFEQFAAHRILASLRSQPSRGQYGVPSGRLFTWVACPHYLAELLIYISFIIVSGAQNITLILIFVFVLLTMFNSASNTYTWYVDRFPAFARSRAALIPGVY